MNQNPENSVHMDARVIRNTSSLYCFVSLLTKKQLGIILDASRGLAVEKLQSEIAENTFLYEEEVASSGAESDRSIELKNLVETLNVYHTSVASAQFDINVVTKRNGEHYGHAYVFVENSKNLYYILIGLNPDGSDRRKRVIDPSYSNPPGFNPTSNPEDIDEYLGEIEDFISASINDICNSDGIELDSPQYRSEVSRIRMEMEPQVISVQGDPYIQIVGIAYEDEQMARSYQDTKTLCTPKKENYATGKELQLLFENQDMEDRSYCSTIEDLKKHHEKEKSDIEEARLTLFMDKYIPMPSCWDTAWDNGDVPSFMPKGYVPQKYAAIEVSPSHVKDPGPRYDKNTICCREAPFWVTEEQIHQHFCKFSTDTRMTNMIEDGVTVCGTFPRIRINSDTGRNSRPDPWGKPMKQIIVRFSKTSSAEFDAAFALQMRRRFTLDVPSKFWIEDEANMQAARTYISNVISSMDGKEYKSFYRNAIDGIPEDERDWYSHVRNRVDNLNFVDSEANDDDLNQLSEAVVAAYKGTKILKTVSLIFNFWEKAAFRASNRQNEGGGKGESGGKGRSRGGGKGSGRGRGGGKGSGRGRGGDAYHTERREYRPQKPIIGSLPPPRVGTPSRIHQAEPQSPLGLLPTHTPVIITGPFPKANNQNENNVFTPNGLPPHQTYTAKITPFGLPMLGTLQKQIREENQVQIDTSAYVNSLEDSTHVNVWLERAATIEKQRINTDNIAQNSPSLRLNVQQKNTKTPPMSGSLRDKNSGFLPPSRPNILSQAKTPQKNAYTPGNFNISF